MCSQSMTQVAGVTAAVIAVLAAVTAADGQTILPLAQDRSVSGFVIVPQCGGTFSDNEAAQSFEPFDGLVEVADSCAAASATAVTEQQSLIGPTSLEGFGTSFSAMSANVQEVIHAFSNCKFEVTFNVPSDSRFTLNAGLDASGASPVVYSQARVELMRAGGAVVFAHSVEPGPAGEPNAQGIDQTGALDPGRYTFRATADTFIDSTAPPNGSGRSSFHVVFGVLRSGDIDGDGDVDLADYVLLHGCLTGPGPVSLPANCSPADLDADVDVDVVDFAGFQNAFGESAP